MFTAWRRPSPENSLQTLSSPLLADQQQQQQQQQGFEWPIDGDAARSRSTSAEGSAAASKAPLSAAEIESFERNERRPSFLGKLLRTLAILIACSCIAAVLPQIQVLLRTHARTHQTHA